MLIDNGSEHLLETIKDEITQDILDGVYKCYPLQEKYKNKKTLPNIILLKENNLINTSNYIVTHYPNNHTEILIKPFTINDQNILDTQKLSIQNSKKSLEVLSSSYSTITIKENGNIQYFTLDTNIKVKKAIDIGGTIHIFASDLTLGTNAYIIIKGNNYTYKRVENLNISTTKIECLCPHYDMAKQASLITFNLKESKFNQKLVYINNSPKLETNDALLPYALLEAIEKDNIKLARHYLSNDINAKLTDNALKSFFGTFINISYDPYNDKLCLVYKEANCYTCKDFDFVVQNGKICDINEL